MVRGFGLVCLLANVFLDVTSLETCYSKSNDQTLNLQCHKYCSNGTCPSFCICGNKVLDTCDPLNFTTNNTIEVLETVTPGTTIFTINVTGKEEWDFTLERGGDVDGSIWNHLSAYLKLTRIGGEYEMIVDRTPDLEDIFYRYAIKLTKLTIHLSCKRGSVSDLSHTITIKITPVNEYAPEFLGAPLIQNVAEDTKVDTLIYGLINHTMDMDVNPTANELASFEIVDYLPDTRYDGRAYFYMKDNVKGCIVLQKALDFEALQPLSATRFFLNLSASDIHGNTSYTTLTINVVDVDDLPPEFYHPGCPLVATKSRPCLVSYEASVPLNFQGPITDIVPGLIEARDMDTQDHPVEYSLEPAPGEKIENLVHFVINKTNGDVTVVTPFSKKTEINLVIVAKEMSEAARSTQASLYIKVDTIKSPFSALQQEMAEEKTEESRTVLDLGQNALIIIGTLSGVTLVLLLAVLFMCGKVRTLSNSVHPAGAGAGHQSNPASPEQPNQTANQTVNQTSAPNKNNSTQAEAQPLAPLGAPEARSLDYDKADDSFSQHGDRSHNSTSNKRNDPGLYINDDLSLSDHRNLVYIHNTLSVPQAYCTSVSKTEPQEKRSDTLASDGLDYSNNKMIKRDALAMMTSESRHSNWAEYEDGRRTLQPNGQSSRATSPNNVTVMRERSPADGSIDSLSTDTLGSPPPTQREGVHSQSRASDIGEDLPTDLHYSSSQSDSSADSPREEENQHHDGDYNTTDVLSLLPIEMPSLSCVQSENQPSADKTASADISTHRIKPGTEVHAKTFIQMEGGNQNIRNQNPLPRNTESLQQCRQNPLRLPRSLTRADGTNWMSSNPGGPRLTTLLLNSAPMKVDVRPYSSPGEYQAVGGYGVQLPHRPWTCVYNHQGTQATAADIEQWKRSSGSGLNSAQTFARHPSSRPSNAASQTTHSTQDGQPQCIHFVSQPTITIDGQQYIPYISQSSQINLDHRESFLSVPTHNAVSGQPPGQPPDATFISQPVDTMKRSPTSRPTTSATREPKRTRHGSHVTRKSWSGILPRPLRKTKKKLKHDIRGETQLVEEARGDLRSRSNLDANLEPIHALDQHSQTFRLNQSFDEHCEKSSQTLVQEVRNLSKTHRLPAMRIPPHQKKLKHIQRSPLIKRLHHGQDIMNVNRTHDGEFSGKMEPDPRHNSHHADDMETRRQTTHKENDGSGNFQ